MDAGLLYPSIVALGLFLGGCADRTQASRAVGEPAASADVDAPADTDETIPAPADDVGDAAKQDARGADAGSPCATTFGTAITAQFGRLDGTVRAVIAPGDTSCRSDDDHVIVQVDAAGSTYVVSINVESDLAPEPQVRIFEKASPLQGPPWSSGWHAGASSLDYAFTLGVHSGGAFLPLPKTALAARIAARVAIGARVSVFGEGFESGEGLHKIHRNSRGTDGALVVDPSGAATYLLFHFAGQAF